MDGWVESQILHFIFQPTSERPRKNEVSKKFFNSIFNIVELREWRVTVPTPLHGGSERMEHLEEDNTEAVDVTLVIDNAVKELVFVSIECSSSARINIFEINNP